MRSHSQPSHLRLVHVIVIVVGMLLLPLTGTPTAPRSAAAAIGASDDHSKPSTLTIHNVSGGGGGGTHVTIVEDVALDFTAGPWLKDLLNNTGSGFASGQDRTISETLTNTGPLTWTDWHERIVSRTTLSQPDDTPGFLFRQDSVTVSADYGSGMMPLTQGVDYQLVITPFNAGGPGNFGHWEAISIIFEPHAVIETGDVLGIRKDIFEVFDDADVWQPGEAARIEQYPTGVPEPGALGMMAIAAGALLRGRGRRARG